MNTDEMDRDLELRLEAYYADAERAEAHRAVAASESRPLKVANERVTKSEHPQQSLHPQHRRPSRWQRLAATAAAVIIVALFARILTLALSGNRHPIAAATPSATHVLAHEPLSALSPSLAAYVSAKGSNMAVVVYDITHNRYYSANESEPFVLASSAKVYILAGYLDWVEGQGRTPSSDEIASLTSMIEQNNNDDAQLLFDRFGGNAQMQRFLGKVGITGYIPCQYGWGCAQLPASAMVRILTLLQQGALLNTADRELALNLLAHVESDQRMGVGETAPPGATVYMKAGWVQWPDPDTWALNSSGIVSTARETYILVVYSQNQPTYDWTSVDHVGSTVAQLLG